MIGMCARFLGPAARSVKPPSTQVAGWSATSLFWEEVPFQELYPTIVEPALVRPFYRAPRALLLYLCARGRGSR